LRVLVFARLSSRLSADFAAGYHGCSASPGLSLVSVSAASFFFFHPLARSTCAPHTGHWSIFVLLFKSLSPFFIDLSLDESDFPFRHISDTPLQLVFRRFFTFLI